MVYAALIALTSVLDLALKSGVESQPDESYPKEVKGTGGLVQVRKLHNEGLPLGVMKERPELVRCLPLAVASSLLLRLSLLLPKKGNHLEKAGLACMIGGAASNLFDRFFRGYVVDYLYVDKKPASRVVFNLGDVFIAGGTVMAGLAGLLRALTGQNRK
ncbi:MAG: signal peptidase II [Stomatobaculum sp.]|nr:signal peptidase II [Stomatobaculum sp.]